MSCNQTLMLADMISTTTKFFFGQYYFGYEAEVIQREIHRNRKQEGNAAETNQT